MKKILLIGYGSIGERHEKNLGFLGFDVGIVTARLQQRKNVFPSVAEALESFRPELYLISNETAKHFQTLSELTSLNKNPIRVLVEKPLFERVYDKIDFSRHEIFTAYQLRFNEGVDHLRKKLKGKKIVSYFSYVGQYLPTWRSARDYTESYSADRDRGGGVLRDLSHELDLAQVFLGKMKSVSAYGGKFSNLKINSDDHFSIIGEYENCPLANISMNYLDHQPRRFVRAITNEETYELDLLTGQISTSKSVEKIVSEKNDAYLKMLRAFGMGENGGVLCSFDEGNVVLYQIDAIEKSSRDGKRVIL